MRALFAAVLATSLSILPIQLLGASAVLVRAELHFDPADLGMAIATFFLAYGASAWMVGHFSQVRGPRVGLVVCAVLSAICLAGIASVAHDWRAMIAFMVIGGIGNAFAQVGGNLALAGAAAARWQGLAFGLKQSAVPAASLAAGVIVPSIGVGFGWRWSFVAALLLAPVLLALLARDFPHGSSMQGDANAPATDWPMMLAVAVAYGGAAGGASVLSTFLIESAVNNGLTVAAAGTMLAAGSVISIVVRLAVGMIVDRRGQADLGVVAAMLFVGTAGFLALAHGSFLLFAIGTVVAFGAGWGWNGAFNHAIVVMNRRNPGKATGLVMIGMALGGVLWPIVFGLLVKYVGFRAAWTATAGLCFAASVLLMVTRRKIAARATAAAAS